MSTVSSLSSLAAKTLTNVQIDPSQITLEAQEIIDLEKQNEQWLHSKANKYYVPLIFTPLTSQQLNIVLNNVDARMRQSNNSDLAVLRSTLQKGVSIPTDYDFSRYVEFSFRDLGQGIDHPDYINQAQELIPMLCNRGVNLKRGDIIDSEVLSSKLDNYIPFIVDEVDGKFVLDECIDDPYEPDDLGVPSQFKAITQFPPRYFEGLFYTRTPRVNFNSDKFLDEMLANMRVEYIEEGPETKLTILITHIDYPSINSANIRYTIIICPSDIGVGKPKSVKGLKKILKRMSAYYQPYESTIDEIQKYYDQNPFSTIIMDDQM